MHTTEYFFKWLKVRFYFFLAVILFYIYKISLEGQPVFSETWPASLLLISFLNRLILVLFQKCSVWFWNLKMGPVTPLV